MLLSNDRLNAEYIAKQSTFNEFLLYLMKLTDPFETPPTSKFDKRFVISKIIFHFILDC